MNTRTKWYCHAGELCMIWVEAQRIKKIICEKSFRDKKATPDIARETYHSPNAVDRYLNDFDRVRFCLKNGLSVEEVSFTTQLSKSLVVEYDDLIKELYGDGEEENVTQLSGRGA